MVEKLSAQAILELQKILNKETGQNHYLDITDEEINQFGNFLLYLYKSELERIAKELKVDELKMTD